MQNPSGLCQCGCGGRTKLARKNYRTLGYETPDEPLRFINGHVNRKWRDGWRYEDRGYVTPCWIWTGRICSQGYAWTRRTGAGTMAHRTVYIQLVGEPPAGIQLHHLCEQKACVNPDHLEECTFSQHQRRHGKLNPALVEEIRVADGTCRAIGNRYGISGTLVWQIRHGKAWRS